MNKYIKASVVCDCVNTDTCQLNLLMLEVPIAVEEQFQICLFHYLYVSFILGCFLNGRVCIICVYLRLVSTVNPNDRDCQYMEWCYVTAGQATVAYCGAHVMEFQVPQCAVNVSQGISNRADILRINTPTK